jgi:hypothetical protein
VERLSHEYGVDASIAERDRLGASGENVAATDQDPHRVVRLDCHDIREAAGELPGEPSGPRAEVEDARFGFQFELLTRAVEQRKEVRRPDAVVGLGDVPEGEAERPRFAQRPASVSGPRNG